MGKGVVGRELEVKRVVMLEARTKTPEKDAEKAGKTEFSAVRSVYSTYMCYCRLHVINPR